MLACLQHTLCALFSSKPLQDAGAACSQLLVCQERYKSRDGVFCQQDPLAVRLLGQAVQLPQLIGAPIPVCGHLHVCMQLSMAELACRVFMHCKLSPACLPSQP